MTSPVHDPTSSAPVSTTAAPGSTGDWDLEDRQALRRVAGLATELDDVSEVEYRRLRLERVVLIGVWVEGTADEADNSMAELAALAETAGSQVLAALVQRRARPDPATYVGAGKAVELRDVVVATGADTVVADGELTPGQLRRLEEVVRVKVVDRTALILDIFAQHASSREGKAQVELAQLQYLLPRLRGWGESLSRQAGGRAAGGVGIGGRGPGETKIELDRRRIRTRISRLKGDLAGMRTARETQRGARRRSSVPQVAVAGYTNAGKSSLLNALTGAGLLVEDALFATLDPTLRRTRTPLRREVVLADTVGFVRHLPTHLVEAFRSTVEEIAGSDAVLHVVDGAHADPLGQLRAVREVLAEVGAGSLREQVVVNKCDVAQESAVRAVLAREPDAVVVSARTGHGLEELRARLDVLVAGPVEPVDVLVPFGRGDLVAEVHADGRGAQVDHTADGTRVRGSVGASLAARLRAAGRRVPA